MTSSKRPFKGSERAPEHDAALQTTLEQMGPVQLCQFVVTHFDAEQLRDLCVDLDVSYENLKGEGPEGKARELVMYLQRRGRLPELAGEIAKLRPDALRVAGDSPGPKAPPQARRVRRRSDVVTPKPPAASPAPGAVNPAQLARLIDRHFNADELRSLCFDLKIDYDNLRGQTKVTKAWSLVQYSMRRRNVAQLVQVCGSLRSGIAWYEPPDTATPKAPDKSAQQAKLRRMLTEHLDESQVRELCASLDVDYESLPGAGKDDMVGELVARLAHHGRSVELVAACMGLRPDIAWEQALAVAEG